MLKKVLVVDDSELIHRMYHLVMNKYRCTLLDAMNGKEALELLASNGDVDLILLDINMPVMNGVQFLERASERGLTDKYPIIVISTEGKEEDTIRALQLGAKGYVKKPFHPKELHALIEKILPQLSPVHSGYCCNSAQ